MAHTRTIDESRRVENPLKVLDGLEIKPGEGVDNH
jgi:hypothetical protein